MINGTIMQYFEWYMPSDSSLWRKVKREAKNLKDIGITAVWLPPAYKGSEGVNDVGYTVYDLYDLGEFDQKGTIPTKYGNKDEYIAAIKELKNQGIDVYADVSLDHKMGADETEMVLAFEDDPKNRNIQISPRELIEAWTKFTFPGRNNKYSSFKWNWTHFDGVDWDEKNKRSALFKFDSKDWNTGVDLEFGNFDYLMGADIDTSNDEVIQEAKKWGKWYADLTDVDGFRLDAAKHISYDFLVDWIKTLRKETGKELFTVAEYWNADTAILTKYLDTISETFSIFDVPLHYHFFDASKQKEGYDLRNIFKNTVVESNPVNAVTFVDNHDTQPGQALESWIEPWFKPLAYSLILLRESGYPCVFYGDYYGIPHNDIASIKDIMDIILKVRRENSYGKQIDYFDNPNVIGWTREGIDGKNGMAVIMSNNCDGEKYMSVGKQYAGIKFRDITQNIKENIIIDNNGCGTFRTRGKKVSIWVEVQ